MHRDEISKGNQTEYTQRCPTCTMEMLILTQNADCQEYDTEIYVQCQCGEFLEFILPVN